MIGQRPGNCHRVGFMALCSQGVDVQLLVYIMGGRAFKFEHKWSTGGLKYRSQRSWQPASQHHVFVDPNGRQERVSSVRPTTYSTANKKLLASAIPVYLLI